MSNFIVIIRKRSGSIFIPGTLFRLLSSLPDRVFISRKSGEWRKLCRAVLYGHTRMPAGNRAGKIQDVLIGICHGMILSLLLCHARRPVAVSHFLFSVVQSRPAVSDSIIFFSALFSHARWPPTVSLRWRIVAPSCRLVPFRIAFLPYFCRIASSASWSLRSFSNVSCSCFLSFSRFS